MGPWVNIGDPMHGLKNPWMFPGDAQLFLGVLTYVGDLWNKHDKWVKINNFLGTPVLFYLAYLLTFYLAYLLISSDILSGTLSGISSDILSGISSDILSGTLSGISSDILSGISSDILSVISSDILSGISSDIFWHSFWHSIWHIFWHSIWHIFWHSIWHIFWYLLTFFLALYLAYLLTFYLAYLLISSDILSGTLSRAMKQHITDHNSTCMHMSSPFSSIVIYCHLFFKWWFKIYHNLSSEFICPSIANYSEVCWHKIFHTRSDIE